MARVSRIWETKEVWGHFWLLESLESGFRGDPRISRIPG